MTTLQNTATPMPGVSNYQIIRRLLQFMKPFNGAMTLSLAARVIKFCGQAAVLGIAAASVGIYVQNSEPGVVNWSVIWTQVGWIAVAGVIVSITSYIEMYLGHYVAFHILMAFCATGSTTRWCRWHRRRPRNSSPARPSVAS